MIFYLLCQYQVGDQNDIILIGLYLYYLINMIIAEENVLYGLILLDIGLLYYQQPLKALPIKFSKKVNKNLEKIEKRTKKLRKRKYRNVKFGDTTREMKYKIRDPPNYVQSYESRYIPMDRSQYEMNDQQRYEQMAGMYEQPQYKIEEQQFHDTNNVIDTRAQLDEFEDQMEEHNFLAQNTEKEYTDTSSEISYDNDIIEN